MAAAPPPAEAAAIDAMAARYGMDPRTVDLMWELYADLGSKVPIRIISGYRSAETNSMLKRIGRK